MELSSSRNQQQQQQQYTTELGVPLSTQASLLEEEAMTQRNPTFGDGSLLGIMAGLWTDMTQALRGHHDDMGNLQVYIDQSSANVVTRELIVCCHPRIN
jgi:hypothetical protein